MREIGHYIAGKRCCFEFVQVAEWWRVFLVATPRQKAYITNVIFSRFSGKGEQARDERGAPDTRLSSLRLSGAFVRFVLAFARLKNAKK